MHDDHELLRRFATQRSEEAFTILVNRHVELVYAAALRRVGGNAALAQDIAQTVFSDLARKAATVPPHVVLAAWLHRATQLAAAVALRTETRRAAREQHAAAMQELDRPSPVSDWESLQPVLDEALDRLPDRDREAVLLRFFQRHSLREVGTALGLSEDAARMRVERALGKLRDLLAARGITTTAAALAAALLGQPAQSAPLGLATALAGLALTSGAKTTALLSTSTFLQTMTATKLQTGLAAALALAAITTSVIQRRELQRVRLENDQLRQEAEQRATIVAQAPSIDAADEARRQREREELMRLRGEITLLRKQQRENAMNGQNEEAGGQGPKFESADAVTEEAAAKEWQRNCLVHLNWTRQRILAFLEFAAAHNHNLPESFEAAGGHLQDQDADGALSGLSDANFEIVFSGSLKDITDPAKTIVLRQKEPMDKPGGGRWKTYAFADGHSEIHREGEKGFEEWERERLPKLRSVPSSAKADQ